MRSSFNVSTLQTQQSVSLPIICCILCDVTKLMFLSARNVNKHNLFYFMLLSLKQYILYLVYLDFLSFSNYFHDMNSFFSLLCSTIVGARIYSQLTANPSLLIHAWQLKCSGEILVTFHLTVCCLVGPLVHGSVSCDVMSP